MYRSSGKESISTNDRCLSWIPSWYGHQLLWWQWHSVGHLYLTIWWGLSISMGLLKLIEKCPIRWKDIDNLPVTLFQFHWSCSRHFCVPSLGSLSMETRSGWCGTLDSVHGKTFFPTKRPHVGWVTGERFCWLKSLNHNEWSPWSHFCVWYEIMVFEPYNG